MLGLVLLGVFGLLVDLLRGEGFRFLCAIFLMVRDSPLILAPSRQRIRSLRACHVIVALLRNHVRFQVAVSTWLLYRTFVGDELLGEDPSVRATNLAFLGSSWRKCQNTSIAQDQQRARLEEDPHKVPEMGVGEFAQMRASFFRLHPNTITPDFKLPHKKFMERLARDYLVHEAILPYELGEIRLHSEAVITKPAWSTTPQQLIKMSHVEEPVQIALEDDAMNRVYAFWTAWNSADIAASTSSKTAELLMCPGDR